MRFNLNKPAMAVSVAFALISQWSFAEHNENINLYEVSVISTIDSRITKHPATVETFNKSQILETVNAATPAQTLKYLPSIQVRERYIGDRNGIIATRTIWHAV